MPTIPACCCCTAAEAIAGEVMADMKKKRKERELMFDGHSQGEFEHRNVSLHGRSLVGS